jgi:hypothetical protein
LEKWSAGSLRLSGNPWLADLSGLSRFELVRGDLIIEGNGVLPQAQIDALRTRIRVLGETVVQDNGD